MKVITITFTTGDWVRIGPYARAQVEDGILRVWKHKDRDGGLRDEHECFPVVNIRSWSYS